MTTVAAPTRARIASARSAGHYRRSVSVTAEFAARTGRTQGSAHQQLLRLRRDYPLALEAFLAADAAERLTAFIAPAETILSRQPIPELTGDLIAEAMRIDGHEDGSLVELLNRLGDPDVARATLRDICREIAVKERLRRAICARHGWQL